MILDLTVGAALAAKITSHQIPSRLKPLLPRLLILLSLSCYGLNSTAGSASDLIVAAKERTTHSVSYDGSYQSIPYPMGDVADNKGVCTDVVIRSYRKLGIDLQALVHEDMQANFTL